MKITDKKILNLGDCYNITRDDFINILKEKFQENDVLYFEREDVYGSIEVSIESYFEREETK